MKIFTFFLSLSLQALSFISYPQSAYNESPDWTTEPFGDVSTGLGLADINGDGYKDMVIANGNDIERQHLVVYYNDGAGNFNDMPDWESEDIDYHGHLSCGDIDSDGDIDVAVAVYIGEEGFDEPGELKVYYNTGAELESNPSFVSDPFYTFSCALGDADGDGDLDLATVAGEPYGDILDKGKVYLNEEGSFSEENIWESDIEMGALDVAFGDFDLNGYQDLVFTCEGTPNYIYLADDDGNIPTTPSWQSKDENNYVNSVEVGYETAYGETTPYIVATENNQLGGQGRVKRYDFPEFPTDSLPSWTSESFGYGSGIKLGYSHLEESFAKTLFYGGWWLPVEARLANEGGFAVPYYTSTSESVVEAIEMADLDKSMIEEQTFNFTNEKDYPVNSIQLLETNVENVVAVTNNESGNNIAFSYVYGESWISLHEKMQPGNTIEVTYTSSFTPDMVISNWDDVGNFVFYNNYSATGFSYQKEETPFNVYPNPAKDVINIEFATKGSYSVKLTGPEGKIVLNEKSPGRHNITYSLNRFSTAAGTYLLSVENPEGHRYTEKIIVK